MCERVHTCVCVSALVYHSVCEEVRGLRTQDWIVGFRFCLPSCGPRGLNSGLQAWLQAPLPAEPSHLLLSGMVKVEMRDGQLPHSAATEWKKRLCSIRGDGGFWVSAVRVPFQYIVSESHLFFYHCCHQTILNRCMPHTEWESQMQILWLSHNYWDNFYPNIRQWV